MSSAKLVNGDATIQVKICQIYFSSNVCSFYVYSINSFQTIPTWFNILYSAFSSSYAVCKLPNFPSSPLLCDHREYIFVGGEVKISFGY